MKKWVLGFMGLVSLAGFLYAAITGFMEIKAVYDSLLAAGASPKAAVLLVAVCTLVSVLGICLMVFIYKRFIRRKK